ncbi:uncharacterized protein LOC119724195 isoform X2 [Patiria miniata]|nr:uncharacterized protein LOC119724195 isoform X2 [Patiria miniata]
MDGPRNKIRISNLSAAASHSKISHIFKKFGQITKVYIQRQGATWNCGGLAYVAYTDAESAAKAVDEMNGEMFDETIMSVELVSEREFLHHVKTMPASSMVDGATKPSRKQKKAPAPTQLTPKDIALAPNAEWEPYIPPSQYGPVQYPAVKKEALSDSPQPLPPGTTPKNNSPFAKKNNSRHEKPQSRKTQAASAVGVARQESKYNPEDRGGRPSLRGTYKSAPKHPVPNMSHKGDHYDPPSTCGDPPRKTAANDSLMQNTLRGDRRSFGDDPYRDPVYQDPPRKMATSDPLTQRSLRGDRRSFGDDPHRDPVYQDLPRSSRADHHTDHSRNHRSHPRSDPEPPLRSLLPRRDYEDDPHLESDRRRHDRYDAPRSRDYEYERFPATSHRERSPSRHHWDLDPLPSTSKRRVYPDDYIEVPRARLYDDDPLRRDPYPRDPYPRDDRRDLDPREERLYREPVRDGYREPDRVDDRYSLERDRADAWGHDDRRLSDDRLYREPERASSQESRTLGIDRPTYDYSLETTLGADRPTYDYSL